MGGQGFAGTVVSLSQIFTALIVPPGSEESSSSTELSALLYFSVAVFVMCVSVFSFGALMRLPIFFHYTDTNGELRPQIQYSSNNSSKSSFSSTSGPTQKKNTIQEYWEIFKQIWDLAIAVTSVFFITLALFPTITGAIESVNETSSSRIFGDIFIPFSFLLFNFGDLIGRTVSSNYQVIPSCFMLGFCLTRIIFFFFFLCSNVVLRDSDGNIIEKSLPVLFGNDYAYWIIMMAFAITNGYFSSLCMMYGPERVKQDEREKAGIIMIYFLVLGLFFGSLFSFALRAILCKCNPFIS